MSKVIIVTGASKGMGRAIAKLVLEKSEDAKVVVCARSKSPLQEFEQKYGDRVLAIAGDLTDKTTVKTVVAQTVAKFGQIDSLVLNAGRLDPVGHIADIDTDELKQLFDINFFSIVGLLHEAIPYLRKSGEGSNGPASCLFVSSGASTKPYDGWMAYGSSKAAVNHVNLDLSVEEAPYIHSISIAPGVVDTDMQRFIREEGGRNMKPEAVKRFTDLHSQGKLLPPEYPGSLYANLALKGIPEELNGKYVRYSDASVKAFIDEERA